MKNGPYIELKNYSGEHQVLLRDFFFLFFFFEEKAELSFSTEPNGKSKKNIS